MVKGADTKRRFTLLAIIILLTGFLVFLKSQNILNSNVTNKPTLETEKTSQSSLDEYKNDFLGMSFYYPKEWSEESGTTSTSRFIHMRPLVQAGEFGANISIIISKTSSITPSNEIKDIMVNGIPAKKFSYDGPQHLPFDEVEFRKNGQYYTITIVYSKEDSSHKKYLEDFYKMLSTFTFNN
jgi:hypothetical protein